MAKKASEIKVPDYVYVVDGKRIELFIGKNGVKKEHILYLLKADHEEYLGNRYEEENKDALFEYKKDRFLKGIDGNDPIELLPYFEDFEFGYEEEHPNINKTRRSKIEELYPLLTKDQVKLIELICAGLSLKEIARRFRTSEDAISKRKRLLINRIKALLEKEII